MSTTVQDRRQELLALEPSLLSWAKALTRDSREADVLVQETLLVARRPDQEPDAGESTRSWLHRLFRRHFHSITRDRSFRRARSNPISALGYVRDRVQLRDTATAVAVADAD